MEETTRQRVNQSVLVTPPVRRKWQPGLMVMLESRDAGDTQGGGMAQVGIDGALTMQRIPPGEYDVVLGTTMGEGDDSYIQAIRIGDTDALVEGGQFGEGPLALLEIVLKSNAGSAEATA